MKIGERITYDFQPEDSTLAGTRTGVVTSIDAEGFATVAAGGRSTWGIFLENGQHYGGSKHHARLKAAMAENKPLPASPNLKVRTGLGADLERMAKRKRAALITWWVNWRAARRRGRR